jgi:hypothetical protein
MMIDAKDITESLLIEEFISRGVCYWSDIKKFIRGYWGSDALDNAFSFNYLRIVGGVCVCGGVVVRIMQKIPQNEGKMKEKLDKGNFGRKSTNEIDLKYLKK